MVARMVDFLTFFREVGQKLPKLPRLRMTAEERAILARQDEFALGSTIPIRGSEAETVLYAFARGICPDCYGKDFQESAQSDQVTVWRCGTEWCGAQFVVRMVEGYKLIDRNLGTTD
jgi:hypothetical protein